MTRVGSQRNRKIKTRFKRPILGVRDERRFIGGQDNVSVVTGFLLNRRAYLCLHGM